MSGFPILGSRIFGRNTHELHEPLQSEPCPTEMIKTRPQRNHQHWLKQAGELLGTAARAFSLSWDLEKAFRRRLKLEASRGLVTEHAIVELETGRRGKSLRFGMNRYRFATRTRVFHVVSVLAPNYERFYCPLDDFWAVASEDFDALNVALRKLAKRSSPGVAPVMTEADRQRLWHNTVGFLRQSPALFRKYQVLQKRGVLLLGSPGNGKTMACRWLQAECRRAGLRWRSVSAEDYREACSKAERLALFHLDRPGIILFDDFDLGIRDRQKFGSRPEHNTFLCELDGLCLRRGTVFLFTSNAALQDLDPASRRPGRIDVVIQFTRPTRHLREQLIVSRWHAEIIAEIDLGHVLDQTENFSFAELEELRTLFVWQFLNTGKWDWSNAWQNFREGHGDRRSSRPIGFANTDSSPGGEHLVETRD